MEQLSFGYAEDINESRHLLDLELEIDEHLSKAKGGGRLHEVAMVLLASAYIGTELSALSKFTGVSKERICEIAPRLVNAEIWHPFRRGEIGPVTWFTSSHSFLLDVMVAAGELVREWDDEELDYRYFVPRSKSLPPPSEILLN